MTWFLLILFLCFILIFNNVSVSEAGRHHKNLPSAVVVGTVICDTCFHNTHFISGASVEVECKDLSSKHSFHQQVKTNQNGEFTVHLPFSVGKHVRRIKKCSVKLLSSSEPFCAVASTATSSVLRLKSRKHRTRIFSAGFFSFKPENQPVLCNEKSSVIGDRLPSFPPPLRDPGENNDFLPPILPLIPLPQLPPLPPIPVLPVLPPATGIPTGPAIPSIPTLSPPVPSFPDNKKTETPTQNQFNKKVAQPDFFPPLRFQPPPLLAPLLPPNPLQPPPAPSIPLPPTPPSLIPSVPPFAPLPPPPLFPFPPSTPHVPGVSPASTSHKTSP